MNGLLNIKKWQGLITLPPNRIAPRRTSRYLTGPRQTALDQTELVKISNSYEWNIKYQKMAGIDYPAPELGRAAPHLTILDGTAPDRTGPNRTGKNFKMVYFTFKNGRD